MEDGAEGAVTSVSAMATAKVTTPTAEVLPKVAVLPRVPADSLELAIMIRNPQYWKAYG